jgi:hypothetical protein
MSTKFFLLSRAALVAGIVATAAFPALAESAQPVPAPSVSTETHNATKSTAVEHKPGMAVEKTQADKAQADKAQADKSKLTKTAQTPVVKKAETPAKSDAGK